MKSEYSAMKYQNYIRRIIILWIVPWLVPGVYLLTREKGESIQWGYMIFPVAFALLTTLILYVARKVLMGILFAIDMDFHVLYELDRRSAKHELHNIKLLIDICFFDGQFQKVVEYADRILQLSSKPADVYMARHQKILSLFLMEKNEEIQELIAQQNQLNKDKKLQTGNGSLYYDFIMAYLRKEYGSAIQCIKEILNEKNIEVLNYKKVLVHYFMLLAYQKMVDTEQIQKCKNEIFRADKEYRTWFSRSLSQHMTIRWLK